MKALPILLLFILIGCGSTETVIQDRTFEAVSPQIRDTILVSRVDTVSVEGEKIIRTDTVIQVKYFPQTKKFYVNVKPDTVRIVFRDTTVTHKTIVEQTPFLSKLGIGAIGFLLCVALMVFAWFKGLFKL